MDWIGVFGGTGEGVDWIGVVGGTGEGVDWINLAQDEYKRPAVVNTVMNLRAP